MHFSKLYRSICGGTVCGVAVSEHGVECQTDIRHTEGMLLLRPNISEIQKLVICRMPPSQSSVGGATANKKILGLGASTEHAQRDLHVYIYIYTHKHMILMFLSM